MIDRKIKLYICVNCQQRVPETGIQNNKCPYCGKPITLDFLVKTR